MKIVVLDRESLGMDTPISRLSKLGELVVYDATSPAEVCERVSDADVILINKVKITADVIASAKNLKLICIFATGYDNIDVKSAKEHGVAVCNVPGYSTASVTATTVATVLSLLTNLREYNNYVVSGEYSESGRPNLLTPVFHDMTDKVWGIVGCGDIGSSVARVAEAFGARIVTHQRHKHPIYETVSLRELCSVSDIITVHCPLTAETRGMIDTSCIGIMKSNAIVVNSARGAVFDEAAVAEAVATGKIAAFGCDVYSVEPFGKDHPFYNIKGLSNVILTPHFAWGSYEARCNCLNIIFNNISSFFDSKILNRVDI